MEEKNNLSTGKPAPLDTILSLLGYENLERYGGARGVKGFPLCYWLRCLTGRSKDGPKYCAGGQKIPSPEVRYFSLSENSYLIQALLALCCFFDQERTSEVGSNGHTYPFVVQEAKNDSCHEFLFLKVGKEEVVLIDIVRFYQLGNLNNSYLTVDIVAVYLQDRFSCHGRLPDSSFVIPLLEEIDYQDRGRARETNKIRVHRIVPVPANELLNGLFRLRKVNKTRQERGKKALPEELRTILIPFLYRQRKQLRSLPMHRARISEIHISSQHHD